MRSGAHRLIGVGGVPGETTSVPSPSRRITCCPAEVTATEPRTTNTPKRPLLGPAKNRVPRTAISAKGLRICTAARALRGGRSNSNGPERSVTSPPASTRNRSIFSRPCSPSLIVVSRPSRIPSLDATPVTTSSPRKTGAARSSVRRPPSSSANVSPLTSSTEPTRSAACAGIPARMNGSASAPWRRSQRRLQGRSRLISPRLVIVDPRQLGVPGSNAYHCHGRQRSILSSGSLGCEQRDAMEPFCVATSRAVDNCNKLRRASVEQSARAPRSARHSRSPHEPDPACRRNFHDPWRRPDTDVAAEDDAAVVAMA